jgi:hypothetical protein
MEVEDGEDGASAGRGEGGADAPAAHERVLFIGTQFSILYTSMYSPA